ncbi:uncharacterized protein L969DRAFT_94498 [Mixia osmundae IAM 14324]|uniref:F-box domain-containing protein n=1 Tax=Mixia osmundae (strain CBS 9802 / IAM 14324 / JCM 22182 / KY 12970) TaxID=764103 RepID=G7E3P1_MIXOS|nr:uncharacterized protein L969DRAFT_94498 [Mixia osmundae IAM 14324]KEI39434.1 hypothetical protein L969DRAFT_94498 [Mixia osmundae IAM 14324]GAA97451.1 hypothetical protein E5Q_04130 [Mixia osmundae IAM 14324]
MAWRYVLATGHRHRRYYPYLLAAQEVARASFLDDEHLHIDRVSRTTQSLTRVQAPIVSSHTSRPGSNEIGLLDLPIEILTRVAIMSGKVDSGSLVALEQVCRLLKVVLSQDYVWCRVTSTEIGDDLVQAGQLARETAIQNVHFCCAKCGQLDDDPHYALADSTQALGRRTPFCRECHASAVMQPRHRNVRTYAADYWRWRASQHDPPRRCTAEEIQSDAWERQLMLWRFDNALFGITWTNLGDAGSGAPTHITCDFANLCEKFVFHSAPSEITMDQIMTDYRLLQERRHQYTAWQAAYPRTTARALDRVYAWVARGKAANLRSFLDLESLAYSLSREDKKTVTAEVGQIPRLGIKGYAYRLQAIILLRFDENKPIGEQLDRLPEWISQHVAAAEGPLPCIKLNCRATATPGCPACLCSSHCTTVDRHHLGFKHDCPVHH